MTLKKTIISRGILSKAVRRHLTTKPLCQIKLYLLYRNLPNIHQEAIFFPFHWMVSLVSGNPSSLIIYSEYILLGLNFPDFVPEISFINNNKNSRICFRHRLTLHSVHQIFRTIVKTSPLHFLPFVSKYFLDSALQWFTIVRNNVTTYNNSRNHLKVGTGTYIHRAD